MCAHSLSIDCMCGLQAGLSALKTPQSLQDSCSREDPLHLPAFRTLAQGLPFAKHVHSKLVCAVTKEIIDEHNPPFVSKPPPVDKRLLHMDWPSDHTRLPLASLA